MAGHRCYLHAVKLCISNSGATPKLPTVIIENRLCPLIPTNFIVVILPDINNLRIFSITFDTFRVIFIDDGKYSCRRTSRGTFYFCSILLSITNQTPPSTESIPFQ